MERLYARTLNAYFEQTNAYGLTQHAFRTKHSCQDLTTLLTSKWLYHFHHHKKVAIFLSDISGAFDRVHTPTLLRKLQATGLHTTWLTFFSDYLSPRNATVIVNGAHSTPFTLSHMVFQGTVLGPLLWNIFSKTLNTPPRRSTLTKQSTRTTSPLSKRTQQRHQTTTSTLTYTTAKPPSTNGATRTE